MGGVHSTKIITEPFQDVFTTTLQTAEITPELPPNVQPDDHYYFRVTAMNDAEIRAGWAVVYYADVGGLGYPFRIEE